ncbi:HIT domain-containing protein [Patescibacteria group bacterium]|nr:HIT domain-containing protein [Patescibacteria group bacterium]
MADDCIFCKIIKKEVETKLLKETENLIVFKDVNPQTAVHVLIVPKKHVRDVTQVTDEIWKEIKDTAVYMAAEKGLKGFRLVHNAGDTAAVPHLHVHFLGDVAPERAV